LRKRRPALAAALAVLTRLAGYRRMARRRKVAVSVVFSVVVVMVEEE
jgi:hypothetical protein